MRHWRRTRQAELDADLRDWALARQAHLRRSAYLLCRDWHLAEDLTQTTLAKLYAAWHRVRDGDTRDAYARRVLYRTFVDETRRGYRREYPGDTIPDTAAPGVDSALRIGRVSMRGPESAKAVTGGATGVAVLTDLADVVEAAHAAVDRHLESRRFDGRFEQAGKSREASRLNVAAQTRFRVPHFAQPQRDGITHLGRE